MSVWICRRPAEEVQAERHAALGSGLPLAGLTVAVKDNIDVAGLPTTCACPAFAYTPTNDATAVARLKAAGAVIAGKTNMDQFATGLVGTRSPHGVVRDSRRPQHIPGGSSSGSAVAVARGEVDLALGTDTAGSGRVPAAFQGIVGTKPTIGLIPTDGVVPACRSFDCVSVFTRTIALAKLAFPVLAHGLKDWSDATRTRPRLAVFPDSALDAMADAYRSAYDTALHRLHDAGTELIEIDPKPFLAAGELLYEGAFVAERYAAVGEFIAAHRPDCDPTVAEIILGARAITATEYLSDQDRVTALRARAAPTLIGVDGLLLPTVPFRPTIAEVTASPLTINRALGVYTTFCNPLDLCAVSLPAAPAADGPFGLTMYAPARKDAALLTAAERLAPVLDPL